MTQSTACPAEYLYAPIIVPLPNGNYFVGGTVVIGGRFPQVHHWGRCLHEPHTDDCSIERKP